MDVYHEIARILGLDPDTVRQANMLTDYITEDNRIILAGIVDFYTSGDYHSDNFSTLYDTLHDIHLSDLIPYRSSMLSGPQPIINMEAVPQQELAGFHRSGWKDIVTQLRQRYHASDATIIFDGFLEKTFLWCRDIAHTLGIIPYTRSWIGFIHHPPIDNETYSHYSVTNLIKEPLFVESLEHCTALCVLSTYLKEWLEANLPGIPVYAFDHPVAIDDVTPFSPKKFTNSIVQVGGWLRDPYAIYALSVDSWISKKALKGKNMDAYFSPVNDPTVLFIPQDVQEVLPEGNHPIHPIHPSLNNLYLWGLMKWVKKNHDEVEVIDLLDDSDYDVLLSKSVVFLYLIDASASNTVNECIVRNTPLVVNRLPAMVEVLGSDYPLFYDDFAQASRIVGDTRLLMEGHKYLTRLDKKRFSMTTFLTSFTAMLAEL